MHIGIWDLDYAFVSSPSDHILPHYNGLDAHLGQTTERHFAEVSSCHGPYRETLKPHAVAHSELLECSCLGVLDVWHLVPHALTLRRLV